VRRAPERPSTCASRPNTPATRATSVRTRAPTSHGHFRQVAITRIPKPDLLLCCTNICQTVLYWYRVLAHHFKVPLIVIDTPFLFERRRRTRSIS